jgi:hypothetical protein
MSDVRVGTSGLAIEGASNRARPSSEAHQEISMANAKVEYVELAGMDCLTGEDGYPVLSIKVWRNAEVAEELRFTLKGEDEVECLEDAANKAREVIEEAIEAEAAENDE